MIQLEYAYLAGLIDGDGSFTLNLQVSGYSSWAQRLDIANSDRGIMEWLKRKLGGHVWEALHPQYKTVCFHWSITTRELEVLIRKVLPYLRIKRRQAEIVLEYRQTVKRIGRKRLSVELLEKRKALAVELKSLHNAQERRLFPLMYKRRKK